MEVKSITLGPRFTPREVKCIERQAMKEGISPSDYCRIATLSSLVMDGNIEAIKIMTANVRRRLAEKFAAVMVGEEKTA